MKYESHGTEVIAIEKGIYKGSLKCNSETDAKAASEELGTIEDNPENDSMISEKYNAEWNY